MAPSISTRPRASLLCRSTAAGGEFDRIRLCAAAHTQFFAGRSLIADLSATASPTSRSSTHPRLHHDHFPAFVYQQPPVSRRNGVGLNNRRRPLRRRSDADGRPELIVANPAARMPSSPPSTGSAALPAPPNSTSRIYGTASPSMKAADLDRDGRPDLVPRGDAPALACSGDARLLGRPHRAGRRRGPRFH